MLPTATLILRNAIVPGSHGIPLTVVVSDGVIAAVGPEPGMALNPGADTKVIDCEERTVIPGIVDAHCHVFAAAAAMGRVDCRPSATPTLDRVIAALRVAAQGGDGWVRGFGYDDSPLGLGRHLTRHDLDIVSETRPVRVTHRSGHADVLNSAGLRAVGIGRDTPAPAGGVIERNDLGEPTGLLLEMASWLRTRAGSSRGADAASSPSTLQQFGRTLSRYGITAVTDAGADNGPQQWRAFAGAMRDGTLPMRVTMMAGSERLHEIRRAGLHHGYVANGGRLRVGHAKIMLTASSGKLHPDPQELSARISAAHDRGFPVAIHAVERDAIVAAALGLQENRAPIGQDRIEHCAECPPDVAELVRESGAKVVTNTGFLHYEGQRYRQTLPEDLLPHLYPAGALANLGIPVELASDAPVVEPNPWATMAAAITRTSAEGYELGGVGVASVADVLRMHTGGNRVKPGHVADLAVVEPDPLSVSSTDLPRVRATLTVVGGRVAWRGVSGGDLAGTLPDVVHHLQE